MAHYTHDMYWGDACAIVTIYKDGEVLCMQYFSENDVRRFPYFGKTKGQRVEEFTEHAIKETLDSINL